MPAKWRLCALCAILVLTAVTVWLVAADKGSQQERRDSLQKLYEAGNYKDAYEGLRKLALDPEDDKDKVGDDMYLAFECLKQLGRLDELDEFREAVIEVHKKNWRLLGAAARSYAFGEHRGYLVAGKFYRSEHRGGGKYITTMERDRVRALQLLQQALGLIKTETDKATLARFHLGLAELLVEYTGIGYAEVGRLQYLTDVSQLPDYDEGYNDLRGNSGASVDADGNPAYYKIPISYAAAQNDGERWRWLLAQAVEFNADLVNEVDIIRATFLRGQFGEQTMVGYDTSFGQAEDKQKAESGTYALHTLTDDETIARLASGVKRFKLPDEHNFIKIYERIAGRGKSTWGEQARDALAQIYENRRQFEKAAVAWKKAIDEYGRGRDDYRQKRLDQIVGNWGRFESVATQSAGKAAKVDYRYRNGDKVTFEAFPVRVSKLLDDVKVYLKSNPKQLDGQRTSLDNIGYRLVEQDQKQYLGDKIASWELPLKPRPHHLDSRITVTTPLKKPGAYLITAKMADGNTSRFILWLSDTVIVRKRLLGQTFCYVADSVTGQPIPRATLDFFGWKQVQLEQNKNDYRVDTISFTEACDADGQLILGRAKEPEDHNWLIVARAPAAQANGEHGAGRFAHLEFNGIWQGGTFDPDYNPTMALAITDRPVYRPRQTVQFKVWVRHAKYDQPDISDFAGKSFKVEIRNPNNDKIFAKDYTTDAYGGLAGEFLLPKDVPLGNYRLHIVGDDVDHGGSSFRVEEYKKPEFEVTIEAPKEAVRLGETVEATIQAKYYFGAPVTNAKVKYKVLRTSYSSAWYPRGKWDWFYGTGYWWFATDYKWYPGWNEWGCARPFPWWIYRGHEQPEIVMESELPIGPDGTVNIAIDTKPAQELHGDRDHQYSITAEIVDESRRTIVGTGQVLVSRKPFQVFASVDRGHYRTGDTIMASFTAHTLDQKPVQGKGELTLYQVSYNDKSEPVEKTVETWKLDTNAEGEAHQQIKAARAGQYRLAYKVTDAKQHTIEGGYLFVVRGEGFNGNTYRFNDLELITDKREYAPGDKVKLLINTNRPDSTVLLFLRPADGVYLPPKVLRFAGKSIEYEVAVVQKDMPNFYIEAVTVADSRVHMEVREVVVPPEKRVLQVEVIPSRQEYKPGQKATVKVKLTDAQGKPFQGSTVMSVYDKSLEYISVGSNVPEIKEYFWKKGRTHYPSTASSLTYSSENWLRQHELGMSDLGMFGGGGTPDIQEQIAGSPLDALARGRYGIGGESGAFGGFSGRIGTSGSLGTVTNSISRIDLINQSENLEQIHRKEPHPLEPTIRKNFADTAFWTASLMTDKDGLAEISLTMPENLTGWKIKTWAMGHGTKVGQGEAIVTTKKDLLVRLQAPRFFMQKDEVVLSANVHNYLKADKDVTVHLEIDGNTLAGTSNLRQEVRISAGGEKRVDWHVRVEREGEAVVRVKAVTDVESDAMEMRFPSYVHGMLKTDSYAGVVRPDKDSAQVSLTVPFDRRLDRSLLEVRYSPTLAGALVDALPYMVDYPYGCTEQTLNRFVPTIVTQHLLQRMKLDLKAIRDKRTNLNSQEIGDDKQRAKGWKRFPRNPVFDENEVADMVRAGIQALAGMQCADGGWGWFSGSGEQSYPHTTAVVIHGLQLAKQNDVALPAGLLERGTEWLKNYQGEQVRRLQNAVTKTKPWKDQADDIDAFVHMVLVDTDIANNDMREFLYRDRTKLSVYAKAMYGLTLHKQQQAEKLNMILKNIEQYLVQDDENQTAFLKLPGDNYWWYWYGSDIEANAYYLKLLARTNPRDEKASRLVKYLLNNRKHGSYWNSTRDTAVCIEALAEYLTASAENKPDMTVEIWLDGKKRKEVRIDNRNLFTFDNRLVLQGDAIESGKHTLEIRRKGTGPVYFNAYLTNFTLEDYITKAGLEVKVNRRYYKLMRVDKKIKVAGARGQVADQQVEKYERTELNNLATLKSGDLVEVELEIDSKNDYEYLLFEDPKAAGFEPVLVRSGYNGNDMGAYMELRDDRVCFFVRALARGKHSVSYRLRAEIPGQFSALPARAEAMYAPELKGNSIEIKLRIED